MINLETLREYAQDNYIPIISQNTETFLQKFCETENISCVLEIGWAIGYSALYFEHILRKYTKNPRIWSREISYPHYHQFLYHTKHSTAITGYLGDFLSYNKKHYLLQNYPYDLLFIDARKSETLDYIKNLSSILHTTKYIIVDDAIKFKNKMNNLYDFLDKHNIPYTIEHLDKDDGVLILPVSQYLLQTLSSQYDLEDQLK